MLVNRGEKGTKTSIGKSAVIINYDLAKCMDILSNLHSKILEYALTDKFYEEYELALYEYFERRGVFLDNGEDADEFFQDEEEFERFMEWYALYFITDGQDRTFPSLYRRAHKYELLPFEDEILKSYEDSWLNLYEVQQVEPGKGFTLRDLFRDRVHWVQDSTLSRILCKWDVTYAGLVSGRSLTFLSGFEPVLIPPRLRESVQKRVLEMFNSDQKEYGLLEEFLKFESAAVIAMIEEILEGYSEEALLNSDGDLLCLTTLHYRITDPAVFTKKINASYLFSRESPRVLEQNFSLKETYTWIRQVKEGLRVYDTPPLGILNIEKDRLRAECNSIERTKKLKTLLEDTFGDCLRYRTMVCQDPEVRVPLWNNRDEESEIVATGGYEKWLDEEIPVLGGMTPREAAVTPGWRERLVDLLKELENENERALRLGLKNDGSPDFPVDKIMKELGL